MRRRLRMIMNACPIHVADDCSAAAHESSAVMSGYGRLVDKRLGGSGVFGVGCRCFTAHQLHAATTLLVS